jgi:UDP-N-acetylmuramoyl-tripeptide--D-alanyl-D-alanine ligase
MNAPVQHGDGMMSLQEAARILGDTAVRAATTFQRVTTDTRQLQQGDLFVALRGEHFDGHAFVAEALRRGAVGAVVEASWADMEGMDGDRPRLIRVPDTALALADLAGAWRLRINPRVVAVTGSNGKTSVKEMLAAILRSAATLEGLSAQDSVLATVGNLNNTLGLPMTLLRLRAGHRWAVVEMGMNRVGEIAAMTRVAQPDVALVNNVQRAHVGMLGSITAVARAKGELFTGMPAAGVAVLPAGEAMTAVLRECAAGHRVVDFALDGPALVQGISRGEMLQISWPEVSFQVRLNVPGRHNRANAVAAAAAAMALGIPAEAVRLGLESFQGVPGRLQSRFSALGALVIDDTYNANPDSVAAAIAVLAERPGRRILVLGDLGELGDEAPELHAEVGRVARAAGIDDCFTLGEWTRETCRAFGAQARHFESAAALVATLQPQLNADATVLVKGSRFMQMERVVEGLVL